MTRAHIEHVPGLAVAKGRAIGCRGRIVIVGLTQIEHGTASAPIRQIIAGRQASEPTFRPSAIVVHEVCSALLPHPDIARSEIIALVWTSAMLQDRAGIARFQSPSRRRTAVAVFYRNCREKMRGRWRGRFLSLGGNSHGPEAVSH